MDSPRRTCTYTVALHRLLRWRLKDHDYDSMGGSFYLYLRGMIGSMGPVAKTDALWRFFDRSP